MTVTDAQAQLLRTAAAQGAAIALWRSPGAGDLVDAAVSLGGLSRREVFADAAGAAPFFAFARLAEPQPGWADAISADIFLSSGVTRYWGGDGYSDSPRFDEQKALVAASEKAAPSPLRSGPANAPAITTPDGYQALVSRALEAIRSGAFAKVVTSRVDPRPLPGGHDLLAMHATLCELYPDAFVALVVAPGIGAWITATPEVLMTVEQQAKSADAIVRTMALAGTQWRKDDGAGEDLASVLWPDKIIEEQALVSRYVRAAFAEAGITELDEQGPRTVRAGVLFHLRSLFAARLPAAGGKTPGRAALGTLLAALHPTSAVCGMPKPAAKTFLDAEEGYDRSYYTGYLGPVGFDGGAALYVKLRSAQIIEDTAYLYVGGGIVEGSVPETEWDETVAKTRTIGAALPPV